MSNTSAPCTPSKRKLAHTTHTKSFTTHLVGCRRQDVLIQLVGFAPRRSVLEELLKQIGPEKPLKASPLAAFAAAAQHCPQVHLTGQVRLGLGLPPLSTLPLSRLRASGLSCTIIAEIHRLLQWHSLNHEALSCHVHAVRQKLCEGSGLHVKLEPSRLTKGSGQQPFHIMLRLHPSVRQGSCNQFRYEFGPSRPSLRLPKHVMTACRPASTWL